MKVISRGLAMQLLLLFALATPLYAQKDKDLKLDRVAVQVEEMKTELTLLQRQVQTMQDTLSKSSGEMSTLINQMSDNISSIRRAQSAVSTNTSEAATQVSAMGERLSATNSRLERLSEQFARLTKLIEDLPKQPVMAQLTPGNPEQLFAAAYADYSRGNFDLALSEFRQYVETYPSSELADNAQYWIGEILYAQRKFSESASEFDKVATLNPKGDKTAPALYKRGLVLIEMNNKDEGIAQLLAVVKNYSKSPEAGLATQQLQRIAPEALEPPSAEAPPAKKALPEQRQRRKP
ncbi:MAG: tol-pal system protein YbgF [Acidobacteriota bacterium]